MVVRSLTLHSNKRQYGPYGKEQGEKFSTSLTSGKIIGFHGRSSTFLDSIGVHLEPSHFVTLGPFGGPGGNQWDDGTYTTIRKFIISHGDTIFSIQFEYDDNGQSKWSKKHGENEGGKRDEVS